MSLGPLFHAPQATEPSVSNQLFSPQSSPQIPKAHPCSSPFLAPWGFSDAFIIEAPGWSDGLPTKPCPQPKRSPHCLWGSDVWPPAHTDDLVLGWQKQRVTGAGPLSLSSGPVVPKPHVVPTLGADLLQGPPATATVGRSGAGAHRHQAPHSSSSDTERLQTQGGRRGAPAPHLWPLHLPRITINKDTKVPNACLFTINKEDHTLGNIIKSQLLKDPQVLFAGYKVPHPLEHKIIIRVQTTPDYSPQEAFTNAITDLISELSLLEERFRVAIKDKQEGIE
uniref:DNA-directed RNA polymerase RBP11-like dimerisation domain-containing protein n=1 Tax=Macaca nemestrina TaxID=9545 RepID=A0A2K6CLP4_MACNE